jgi:uncharacterized membrane protein
MVGSNHVVGRADKATGIGTSTIGTSTIDNSGSARGGATTRHSGGHREAQRHNRQTHSYYR